MNIKPSPANAAVAAQAWIAGHDDVERFERMTRLVGRLLDMPVMSLDLPDLGHGHGHETAACNGPLLKWAARQTAPCFVPDARLEPELARDPCVQLSNGLRAVGCWPLLDSDRQRLGTLLIADRVPRHVTQAEFELLGDLAHCVEAEVATQRLAHVDGLTGLCNRRGFNRAGAQLMELCRRHGNGLSLLSFDLDGFKSINDLHGHAEGDRAFVCFARMLEERFRASDLIGRMGGDEFVVLVPQPGDRIAADVDERLQQAASDCRGRLQTPYEIRFSVGCAEFEPERHACLDDLLRCGDAAMYAKKRVHGIQGGPEIALP